MVLASVNTHKKYGPRDLMVEQLGLKVCLLVHKYIGPRDEIVDLSHAKV